VFGRPESTFELILFGGLLITTVLGLVSVPGAWRRAAGPTAAIAPKVVGAYLVLLVVVGILAGALTGSASRMPGDLTIHAKDFAYSTAVLEADAGRIGVWIDNEDVSHHDFTIKGVVSQQLPAQKASRAVFDLEPGTYRFFCSLHPDMEGTLKVT
jgi:plastocyanin